MFASSAMALGPTSPASPVTGGNVIKAQYVVKKKVVKRPVVRKKVIVRERTVYAPGSRHAHPPRGWHRYHARPHDWRTRGCIIVGPVWFCP
jgi:hypothetical protein